MGGTVAVTLRDVDGTEYRMNRWTNSMSWGICNAKMFVKDRDHINAYLKQWLELKSDWEANHYGGNFKYEMTDYYFPNPGLVPDGYGLVVVDLMNDTILDMQGYTSFDNIGAASVSLSLSGNILGEDEDDNEVTRLKDLWDLGLIKGWDTTETFEAGREFDPIPYTFDEVIKMLGDFKSQLFTTNRVFHFLIDVPFTYKKYEEYNPQALRDMRHDVQALGFKLTDEELKYWEEHIKEAEEEYED